MVANALEARNPQTYEEVQAFTKDMNVKIDVSPENQQYFDSIQEILGDQLDISIAHMGFKSSSAWGDISWRLSYFLDKNPDALSQDQLKKVIVELTKIGINEGEVPSGAALLDKLNSGDFEIYMGDELDDPFFTERVSYALVPKEDASVVNLKLTKINSVQTLANAPESFGKVAKLVWVVV